MKYTSLFLAGAVALVLSGCLNTDTKTAVNEEVNAAKQEMKHEMHEHKHDMDHEMHEHGVSKKDMETIKSTLDYSDIEQEMKEKLLNFDVTDVRISSYSKGIDCIFYADKNIMRADNFKYYAKYVADKIRTTRNIPDASIRVSLQNNKTKKYIFGGKY